MKNSRGFAFGLVIGLALAISSIGFAQSTITQTDQKEATSCCAMASCCKGDSCQMKHDSKSHSAMKGTAGCCCCCTGDCELEMKNKEKGN